MSIIAKMYVEDKQINILDYKFRFTRAVDEHGFPMGRPNGTVFEIIYETTSDQSFMTWAVATAMTKHVKIVVSPVTGTSKSRVIELYDVHCVHFKNNFNAKNGEPMTTLIHLTPAIMIDDGYKVLDHYWKKTDLSAKATITTVEPEKEPKLIEAYYKNEKGERVEEIHEGNVSLFIKTEDLIGKSIDIDLSDNNYDFLYKGILIEDNLLKNIQVMKNTFEIELEVIKQNSKN